LLELSFNPNYLTAVGKFLCSVALKIRFRVCLFILFKLFTVLFFFHVFLAVVQTKIETSRWQRHGCGVGCHGNAISRYQGNVVGVVSHSQLLQSLSTQPAVCSLHAHDALRNTRL